MERVRYLGAGVYESHRALKISTPLASPTPVEHTRAHARAHAHTNRSTTHNKNARVERRMRDRVAFGGRRGEREGEGIIKNMRIKYEKKIYNNNDKNRRRSGGIMYRSGMFFLYIHFFTQRRPMG